MFTRRRATRRGMARAGLSNPKLDGGVALEIAYSAATLPMLGLWRAWQSGIYAVGLEPHSVLTPPEQASPDQEVLQAGEARDYRLVVSVARLGS